MNEASGQPVLPAEDQAAALAAYLNGDKTALKVDEATAALLEDVIRWHPGKDWSMEALRKSAFYFLQFVVGRQVLRELRLLGVRYVWRDQADGTQEMARRVAAIAVGHHNVRKIESVGLTLRFAACTCED